MNKAKIKKDEFASIQVEYSNGKISYEIAKILAVKKNTVHVLFIEDGKKMNVHKDTVSSDSVKHISNLFHITENKNLKKLKKELHDCGSTIMVLMEEISRLRLQPNSNFRHQRRPSI